MRAQKALEDYLDARNRTETTKVRYLQALEVVQREIPDMKLDRTNIRGFLAGLQRKKYRSNTLRFYYKFLKSFVEGVQDKDWPLRKKDIPVFADKPRKPIYAPEVILKMIDKAQKINLERDELARLVFVTTYFPRRSEAAELKQGDIDAKAGTIKVRTKKHGEPRTHVLYDEIKPYFTGVELYPLTINQMDYGWKKIEKKCGVLHGPGCGIHAVRRRGVTELLKYSRRRLGERGKRTAEEPTLTKNDVFLFLRWKIPKTIIDEYEVQTDEEMAELLLGVDREIAEYHPFLKEWKK